VTEQLQIGSQRFHCKVAKVSTVGMVSLKTKFEGILLNLVAQPMSGWLMTWSNC